MRTIAEYRDKYAGRRFVIVGKGPTRFRYENLANVTDPVIFINDAVQFEKHATATPETFFFAHDPCQACWCDGKLSSTAVLPLANSTDSAKVPMLSIEAHPEVRRAPALVGYNWDNGWREHQTHEPRVTDKGRLIRTQAPYIGVGTIHTAIHFAWLCGASSAALIGCDGFQKVGAYDPRISIASGGESKNVHNRIRERQDWLCAALGLSTDYVNEPSIEECIPRLAHFIWLGPSLPLWAQDNIDLFRKLHPTWTVRLWSAPPADMPDDLAAIMADAEQICMQKDVLSYWLLWSRGGLFLDCDMVSLRSMERLLRYSAFVSRDHSGRVNCCAMGAKKESPTMGRIIDEVRSAAQAGSGIRTRYGPKLLTGIFGKIGDGTPDCAVLPRHYFCLFIDQKEAHPWWKADEVGRRRMIEAKADRISDPTPPYTIHLWGVSGSSKRPSGGHADALIARLRIMDSPELEGAEVGVLAGNLSARLLQALPALRLHMVDLWSGGDTGKSSYGGRIGGERDRAFAMEVTDFAAERRIEHRSDSIKAAGEFGGSSLDFVFIDADHEYSAVKRDILAWWPKVRPGGLLCGHDYENPIGVHEGVQRWDVKRAVTEFMAEHGIDGSPELGGGTTWFVWKAQNDDSSLSD